MLVSKIDNKDAWGFISSRHYAGRRPSISYAFGDIEGGFVCTFGSPASAPLIHGIAGKAYKSNVIELNRVVNTSKTQTSSLLATALRLLKHQGNFIVVSYADTAMGHVGTIYQATNFMYSGKTQSRTDKYVAGGKHSRHYRESDQGEFRVVRSAKHRYIKLVSSNRGWIARAKKEIKYPVDLEYPKISGERQRYILGEFISPKLIKI